MNIHFLGTASGLPTATRFSQTIVLEHDDSLTLLDVADGASMLLARQGLDHLHIRRIVISHMHADHHSGLVQLIKTMMHLGHRGTVIIWAPEEGIGAIQAFLQVCYLIPQWLGFTIEWRAIEPQVVLDTKLTLRAWPNHHMAPARQRAETELSLVPPEWQFESYSFTMTVDGYQLAYSGNLASSPLEMLPYAHKADVLIVECAHLSPDELKTSLPRLKCAHILLTHIAPQFDAALQSLRWDATLSVRLMQDSEVVSI